jgi:hypothetical protein
MGASTIMLLDPEFEELPADQREAVFKLQDAMLAIERDGNVVRACKRLAMLHGHARKGWGAWNLRRRYYGWLKSGKSWTALVDWASAPRSPRAERDRFAQAFLAYFERNQRAHKPAWRELMRDLARGARIGELGTWREIWMAQHTGQTPPPEFPRGWVPRGWKYENALRKAKATRFELEVMRRGPAAARAFAPSVHTTRAGLRPGQLYQFDDVWHDIRIIAPGTREEALRPLEWTCMDVASACTIAWLMRAQVRREDGTREGLTRWQFKMLVAQILTQIGWHPDGCVFVVEHGSASLTPRERELITLATGGKVTFRDSDPLDKPLMRGTFAGPGHGNFRTKALLEASHRWVHYEAAALPAQTGGLSRVDAPEQLYGLERHMAKVADALDRVPPDLRDMLYRGVLPFHAYARLAHDLRGIINTRTEHRIEGWEENGWMKEEWSADGSAWLALPPGGVAALPEASRRMAEIALASPGLHRCVRMSPQDVWDRARHGDGTLERVPPWALVDFLGDDCRRDVRLGDNGLFELQDRDLFGTSSRQRYNSLCARPDGTGAVLHPGETYRLYPFPPANAAVVAGLENGEIIGMVAAWSSVSPLNSGQVAAAVELQARMLGHAAAGVRERHAEAAEDRAAAMEFTDGIIEAADQRRQRKGKQMKETAADTRRAMAALGMSGMRKRHGQAVATEDGW